MGLDFPGTRVARSIAGRVAEFRTSRGPETRSQRRDVVDFGFGKLEVHASDDYGEPDFDYAVSTLVVRALPQCFLEAPKYWFRKVRVITLSEVFCNYQHDADFQQIYDAWLEGAVVIRKHRTRGVAGGKRRRN